MNCEFYNDPFDHILIKESYTTDELNFIWKEIDELTPELKGAKYTLSALNSKGEYKKKNKGVFIDYIQDNKNSTILRTKNKFLKDLKCDISGIIFKYYPCFNPIKEVSYENNSLLSYYSDGDYYEAHRDTSLFTLVTFLCKDQSKFSGGELIFPEFNLKIDPINNVSIIFPSVVEHEVLPINLLDNFSNFGRYSITTFINVPSKNQVNINQFSVGDVIDLTNISHFNFSP